MKKKVVIVHDWLYGGGAERVVHALHKMYPDAPIYTSYCTPQWQKKLNNKVVTGYLNTWPFTRLRKFLPVLRMWWFRSLDLSGYDLIISSSGNGEAKHVRKTRPGQIHICYTHTPVHFYWRNYRQYLDRPGFGMFDPLARIGLKLLVRPLRSADYKAAQKVDHFVANSTHIGRDIETFYERHSEVVFPPIDTLRFSNAAKKYKDVKRSGFVTVSRLVTYKRFDIIVQACTQLGVPLKVVGRGPDLPRLKKLAGPTIEFLTNEDDEAVARHMVSAEAFLFAAFEDFGVTPVEAMAAGTPVIAYKAGGALDYVIPGKTGDFFTEQTTESLVQALNAFTPAAFDKKTLKIHSMKFSESEFRTKMSDLIYKELNTQK